MLAHEQFGSARLCLTSASGLLAASLTRLAGDQVVVSPMLHDYPAAPRAEDEICTIGFLGSPREDKGRRLLARVAQACAFARPDAQVVVQVPASFVDRPPEGWPANVEELPVGLERTAFWELVTRLDLAVLPYDMRTFGMMTSGVFADAVAASRSRSSASTGSRSLVPSRISIICTPARVRRARHGVWTRGSQDM